MTYEKPVKIDDVNRTLQALNEARNDYLSAVAYASLRKRPYAPNLKIHLNKIHAASDELKNIEARLKEGKNES